MRVFFISLLLMILFGDCEKLGDVVLPKKVHIASDTFNYAKMTK